MRNYVTSRREEGAPSARSDLIAAAYAAFNRRDIDFVLALMAPDVDWPNGMEGGRVIGHNQVRAYWTRQWESLNPRVDPVEIEEDQSGRAIVRIALFNNSEARQLGEEGDP